MSPYDKKGLSHCEGAWWHTNKEKKLWTQLQMSIQLGIMMPWTKMLQGGDGEIERSHYLICALQCIEGEQITLWNMKKKGRQKKKHP